MGNNLFTSFSSSWHRPLCHSLVLLFFMASCEKSIAQYTGAIRYDPPKPDTVKIIMLISNTGEHISWTEQLGKTYEIKGKDYHSVMWNIGYRVADYAKNKYSFLDERKEKLSEDILIWDYKMMTQDMQHK